MKTRFSGMLVAALAVAGVLGTSSKANAALLIDFDNVVFDGGTVTSLPGNNFSGSNIIFDSIHLRDSANLGVSLAGLQCGATNTEPGDALIADTCRLSFNTATNTILLETTTGLWDIGDDQLPYTDDRGALVLGAEQTVLSGTFNNWLGGPNGFLGFGIDTKDPSLLRFFGLPLDTTFSFVNTEITMVNGAVLEADLTNIASAPVPEPATMMLLGTGLLAAFRARRKSA